MQHPFEKHYRRSSDKTCLPTTKFSREDKKMKPINIKQHWSLLLGIAAMLLACNMPFVQKSDYQSEYTDLMDEEYLTQRS